MDGMVVTGIVEFHIYSREIIFIILFHQTNQVVGLAEAEKKTSIYSIICLFGHVCVQQSFVSASIQVGFYCTIKRDVNISGVEPGWNGFCISVGGGQRHTRT